MQQSVRVQPTIEILVRATGKVATTNQIVAPRKISKLKGGKRKSAISFWDPTIVPKKKLDAIICEKIIVGDSDDWNSIWVGLNPIVNAQLVVNPAFMPALGAKKSSLSLS